MNTISSVTSHGLSENEIALTKPTEFGTLNPKHVIRTLSIGGYHLSIASNKPDELRQASAALAKLAEAAADMANWATDAATDMESLVAS